MALDSLDFPEIAELLNHSRTTQIDLTPTRQQYPFWAHYTGFYKVHTARLPFSVLYLTSKATRESIERAAHEVFHAGETQVVYAPSLDKRHHVHHERFERYAKGFWNSKDYLSSFIKEELEAYLTKLRALQGRYYIDPPVETPAGIPRTRPNPILSALLDPLPDNREGLLAIVLAEPGQGKTYMSYDLVSKLCAASIVPIYINSTQWTSIPVDDLGSLWKTITHSFRSLQSPISWVDGYEDQFLRVTLKAEIFKIIFDGFDEYVLWNRGQIRAVDVLDALADLASSTGARIAITSRTSFWQTNVSEDDAQAFLERTHSALYKILPFDEPHARNYFLKRLPNKASAEQALSFYRSVRHDGEELAGRGFVLSLVADLFEQDRPAISGRPGGFNAIEWLIHALCERETLRQRLPLSADDQVFALRMFAAEVAQGVAPDTALMRLAINYAAQHLQPEPLEECVEKFKSHPLVTKDPGTDRWGWVEEQLEVVFLARHLILLTERVSADSASLSHFLGTATFDAGRVNDIAAMSIDLLTRGAPDPPGRTQSFIHALLGSRSDKRSTVVLSPGARALAVASALTAVDQLLPKGSPRDDRSRLFVRLLRGSPVELLPFSGTIARMDLRHVTFQGCRFEHVTWANCRFDNTTIFDECHFIGGSTAYSEGFGASQWKGGTRDAAASAWINTARINEGRRAYTADDLRADLSLLLGKFVLKGGLGLKTIEKSYLLKGPIKESRYRNDIVDELLNQVLEEHSISGTSESGYNVRDNAVEAVKFYATNNVFTGPLTVMFDRLKTRLRLGAD